MEEHEDEECVTIASQSQNGTHNIIHRVYFVKFQSFPDEIQKEEADKHYKLLGLALSRIKQDIDQRKADEHHINMKLMWFSHYDHYAQLIRREIESLQGCQSKVIPQFRTNLDRKQHCQKRLIKKGRLDTEYLQQLQEQIFATTSGTQELTYLIKSMAQRIQHGNRNRADEMRIYHQTKNVKESRALYTAQESDTRTNWDSRELRKSKRDIDQERAVQHKIKIRLDEIENIKMDLKGRKTAVSRLKAELVLVRNDILCLQNELEDVNSKRSEAYKRAYELGKQKKGLKYVNKLIREGDVGGLKQVCDTQVQGFMRQWTKSKAFRDDYEKRKLVSKGLGAVV